MSQTNPKVLQVVTGPTAVGKTELALRWAEANNAEIISCDSLLFYRGMDIGTAKPTRSELARVPHHLVDVCDVAERMDITRYVDLVRRALQEIHARGRRVLVVGGSGFYLRSFFSAVADDVAVPAELRAEIDAVLQTQGLGALIEELRRLDPAGAARIDLSNPRRVVRALERCRASGRTLGELAAEFARQPAPYDGWRAELVRLDREPAELGRRIQDRVTAMLSDGLVAEVQRLRAAGLKDNPSASRAIGYRETIEMLEGGLSPAELAPKIVLNTRALVKKQRTWFRTQLPPHRIIAATEATPETLFEKR